MVLFLYSQKYKSCDPSIRDLSNTTLLWVNLLTSTTHTPDNSFFFDTSNLYDTLNHDVDIHDAQHATFHLSAVYCINSTTTAVYFCWIDFATTVLIVLHIQFDGVSISFNQDLYHNISGQAALFGQMTSAALSTVSTDGNIDS